VFNKINIKKILIWKIIGTIDNFKFPLRTLRWWVTDINIISRLPVLGQNQLLELMPLSLATRFQFSMTQPLPLWLRLKDEFTRLATCFRKTHEHLRPNTACVVFEKGLLCEAHRIDSSSKSCLQLERRIIVSECQTRVFERLLNSLRIDGLLLKRESTYINLYKWYIYLIMSYYIYIYI